MKNISVKLIITALLLCACRPGIESEQTTQSPVDNHDETLPAIQYGEAENVESVHAVYPSELAGDMQIVISGFLADGCTEIDKISSILFENNYMVKIFTKKDNAAMCTAALEPFEKTITLKTSELKEGHYSVDVYSVSTEFEIEGSVESSDSCG